MRIDPHGIITRGGMLLRLATRFEQIAMTDFVDLEQGLRRAYSQGLNF